MVDLCGQFRQGGPGESVFRAGRVDEHGRVGQPASGSGCWLNFDQGGGDADPTPESVPLRSWNFRRINPGHSDPVPMMFGILNGQRIVIRDIDDAATDGIGADDTAEAQGADK